MKISTSGVGVGTIVDVPLKLVVTSTSYWRMSVLDCQLNKVLKSQLTHSNFVNPFRVVQKVKIVLENLEMTQKSDITDKTDKLGLIY